MRHYETLSCLSVFLYTFFLSHPALKAVVWTPNLLMDGTAPTNSYYWWLLLLFITNYMITSIEASSRGFWGLLCLEEGFIFLEPDWETPWLLAAFYKMGPTMMVHIGCRNLVFARFRCCAEEFRSPRSKGSIPLASPSRIPASTQRLKSSLAYWSSAHPS